MRARKISLGLEEEEQAVPWQRTEKNVCVVTPMQERRDLVDVRLLTYGRGMDEQP